MNLGLGQEVSRQSFALEEEFNFENMLGCNLDFNIPAKIVPVRHVSIGKRSTLMAPQPMAEETHPSTPVNELVDNHKPEKVTASKRGNRTDLPCKAVIRQCRKHYNTKLQKKCDYIIKKRGKDSGFYARCIRETLADELDLPATDRIVFFLAAFMYPKDADKFLDSLLPADMERETAKAMIKDLHDLRVKFTHERLNSFIEIPEMQRIFIKFA